MNKTKRILIAVSDDLKAQMQKQAKRLDMSLSEYIRQLHNDSSSQYSELLKEWQVLGRNVLHIHELFPFDAGNILAAVELKIKVLTAKVSDETN